MMTQPWQTVMFTAMTANFIPLLAPANPESYDTLQFYNAGLAIVAGGCSAALSFRLMPPLSPAFRTRRLLTLSLRELRRLATAAVPRTPEHWQGRIYGRLRALPEGASPLQRAQLLTALSVGRGIVRLRRIVRRFGPSANLDGALEALAEGNSRIAILRFARLDQALASRPGAARATLRARGLILAISQALTQHAAYFDTGGRG